LNGVNKRNISKSMRKLFTNDGTLKVNLGSAHKGWQLVCKKKTKLKSAAEAYAEAMDHIASMIKNNAVGKDKGVKFWFARRTLGLIFFAFQSSTIGLKQGDKLFNGCLFLFSLDMVGTFW